MGLIGIALAFLVCTSHRCIGQIAPNHPPLDDLKRSLSNQPAALAPHHSLKRLAVSLLSLGRPTAGWQVLGRREYPSSRISNAQIARRILAFVGSSPPQISIPRRGSTGGLKRGSTRRSRAAAPMSSVRMDMDITGLRSRRFSGSIVIDAGVEDVWAVITDYNHQAEILPTLTGSRRLPSPDGTILVEQESRAPPGLPGLDERQFNTIRIVERPDLPTRTLESSLHASKMFESLTSKTTLEQLSAGRTKLTYTFEFMLKKRQVLFKGPQLLLLFEFKCKNETPDNLNMIKKAAEGLLAGYQNKGANGMP